MYLLFHDFFSLVVLTVLLTLTLFLSFNAISEMTQALQSLAFNFISNAGLLSFGGAPSTLIWANVIHYQES